AVSKDMPQPRPTFENGFQDIRRAVSVLNARRMDHETNHQAESINHNMTFATVDLLPRIKTSYSAAFRGFHRLAIDHTSRGAGLLVGLFTRNHHKRVVDGPQHAIISPAVEIFLHRGEWWEFSRQKPPRTTRRSYIKKRVHHFSQVCLSRATERSWQRHQRFEHRPFRIR